MQRVFNTAVILRDDRESWCAGGPGVRALLRSEVGGNGANNPG